MKKPIIGILACARMIDDDSDLHHVVFRRYVDFVSETLNAVPVLIPSLFGETKGKTDDTECICEMMDGFFLPGSPTNVSVRREKGQVPAFLAINTTGQTDLFRDYTAMKILHHAVTTDKPLLAVCRGFQEMNVFFGGDLHKTLHLVPGRFDHRALKTTLLFEKYKSVHEVTLTNDSLIKQLVARDVSVSDSFAVNSLHSQGISVIGDELCVECLATDGTIEALRHSKASFIYGVQWHLEWLCSPLDKYIAQEFIYHCNRNKLKRS